MAKRQFKVRDLVISVGPSARAGAVGVFVETPPTPFTPITPVAATAALTPKLRIVDAVIREGAKAEVATLDRVATEIGRAVVGAHIASRLGRGAYCTQDMQTCQAGERISPYAAEGIAALELTDLDLLAEIMESKD